MKKIGKSVLKEKPPKPHKLSEAELKELHERQERQREVQEEKRKSEKIPTEKPPEGIVEPKEERLKGLAGFMERANKPVQPQEKTTEDKDEDKEDEIPGLAKPKRRLRVVRDVPEKTDTIEGLAEEE